MGPPPAPPLPRSLELRTRQLAGLPLLLALIAAALLGAFGAEAAETVPRVAVIYGALMAGFRLLGKRELSEMSAFDLVTLMMIPEIVSSALNGERGVGVSLLGAATLFTLVFLTSMLSHYVRPAAAALEGTPTVLVERGRYRPVAMNRERVSEDELLTELHRNGLASVGDAEWVILEPDGKISVIPKKPAGPLPAGAPPDDPRVY